jgi:hypothetical protein
VNRYTVRKHSKSLPDEWGEIYLPIAPNPDIFHSPTPLTEEMIMLY